MIPVGRPRCALCNLLADDWGYDSFVATRNIRPILCDIGIPAITNVVVIA